MVQKRVRYRRIDQTMGIDEVNKILVRQYKYDLYNFTISLVVALSDSPILGFWNISEIKNVKIPSVGLVKAEIKSLSDIRSRITRIAEPLKRHLGTLPRWHQIRRGEANRDLPRIAFGQDFLNMPNADEITRKAYKLDDVLDVINREVDYLTDSMYKPFRKRRGKITEPSIIIHAFWSLVIRRNGRTDMKNVEMLVKWFAKRLKDTDYETKLSYAYDGSSIYRCIKENREKLEADKAIFFPDIDSPGISRTIQIEFTIDSIKVGSFNRRCRDRQSPLIIFPDGSVFPVGSRR